MLNTNIQNHTTKQLFQAFRRTPSVHYINISLKLQFKSNFLRKYISKQVSRSISRNFHGRKNTFESLVDGQFVYLISEEKNYDFNEFIYIIDVGN